LKNKLKKCERCKNRISFEEENEEIRTVSYLEYMHKGCKKAEGSYKRGRGNNQCHRSEK
jgi:hypothetical protein